MTFRPHPRVPLPDINCATHSDATGAPHVHTLPQYSISTCIKAHHIPICICTIEVVIFLRDLVLMSLGLHPYSYIFFGIISGGYILKSLVLNYFYYYLRGQTQQDIDTWKIQPNVNNEIGSRIGHLWGHPLVSNKPDRAAYHGLLASINLFIASCFALTVCELSIRGYSYMNFDMSVPLLLENNDMISNVLYREAQGVDGEEAVMRLNSIQDLYTYMTILFTRYCQPEKMVAAHFYHMLYMCILFLGEVMMAILWQSVLEYYWHVVMHWPFFYKHMHKWHHTYKAPELFDDMYIHPLEAVGYYCILYSPPFLPFLQLHVLSFLAYMAIMGICGVLDHSGISMRIPGLYDTRDHDIHHLLTLVNYSFPFPFMDYLHGTYVSPEKLQQQQKEKEKKKKKEKEKKEKVMIDRERS